MNHLVKKYAILFMLLLLGLNACNKPEVTPPSVLDSLNQFKPLLEKGSRKEFENLYFMPLHWRNKEKLLKAFKLQHNQVKQKTLDYAIKSFKQKGRWAVAILIKTQGNKQSVEPLWLFYYNKHWQIISPIIFHTSTVRSMMNLYQEQEELTQWFITQAKKLKLKLKKVS